MMFSGKIFLAASLALSTMDGVVAQPVIYGADCWVDDKCTEGVSVNVLTNGDGNCLLPPNVPGNYPLGTGFPGAFYMGDPQYWCGSRKSMVSQAEANKFCFDIGAKSACTWQDAGCLETCVPKDPVGVFGDPHFKTWGGVDYDYHGVCDLLFLESETHNMVVHIRTTQKLHYSYVSSAVIEINGETMEFGSYGEVIQDGVDLSSDSALPETLGGMPLSVVLTNKKIHTYAISLGEATGIEIKIVKEMVGVKLIGSRAAFADSRGLMGSAVTGERLARDGVTIIEDMNEFGQEWQVRADEKMLFDAVREPQAPAQCFVPTASAQAGRRLGETMARAEAEEACKNWGMNKEACINDVMVTGDVDFASVF